MDEELNFGAPTGRLRKREFNVYTLASTEPLGYHERLDRFIHGPKANLLEKSSFTLWENDCAELVQFKRNVITVGAQLMRPALKGLGFGGILCLTALLGGGVAGGVEGLVRLILAPIICAAGVTAFCLRKIAWHDLGVLIIQTNSTFRQEFFAANETIDTLCSHMRNRGCRVEELTSEDAGKPQG